MKFLVLGDVHAKLKLINKRIDEHPDVDYVLQCGDLGIWDDIDFEYWGYVDDGSGHWDVNDEMAPITDIINGKLILKKKVYFITGNHENFFLKEKLYASGDLNKNNLYYISYDRPATIGKVVVSGLSGCFSYKIYTGGMQKKRKIKVKPQTPEHIEAYLNKVLGRDPRGRFTYKEVEEIKKQKSDILLLHEPPIGMYSSGELKINQKPGSSPINEIIKKMQPKFVFIGHMHLWGYMEIGRTKIVGLPCVENGCAILDVDKWEFNKFD